MGGMYCCYSTESLTPLPIRCRTMVERHTIVHHLLDTASVDMMTTDVDESLIFMPWSSKEAIYVISNLAMGISYPFWAQHEPNQGFNNVRHGTQQCHGGAYILSSRNMAWHLSTCDPLIKPVVGMVPEHRVQHKVQQHIDCRIIGEAACSHRRRIRSVSTAYQNESSVQRTMRKAANNT